MGKKTTIWVAITVICLFSTGTSNAAALDIGIAWVGPSGMANRVFNGFEQGIKEMAPKVVIDCQKELDSMDRLAEIVEHWEKEKSAMVILRSNGAEWLGKNPPAIPTFIGACNHPEQLGVIQHMDVPEGNITGVTYFLPAEKQFAIFQAVLPKMQSILLLLERDHPSSVIDQSQTKAVCGKRGIQYHEAFCDSPESALEAVRQYRDNVSAIIIGNQALNIDNANGIVQAAGKTPVFSFSAKPVQAGALGGFVADDEKLGYMLAESVVDVLVKGEAVQAVAVKMDPNPKFFVNSTTAQTLGLEIPYAVLETAAIVE